MSFSHRMSFSKRLLSRALLLILISLCGILWVSSEEPSGGSEEVLITEVQKSSKLRLAFQSDEQGDFCPEYSTDMGQSWVPLHNFTHHYSDGLHVCYIELPLHLSDSFIFRVLRIYQELRPTIFPQHPTVCPANHTTCPGTPTQCISIFATHCPANATVTTCPRVPTSCGGEATFCPPDSTRCPARPTICSVDEHPTFCPVLATACPTGETVCPVAVTACPYQITVCPESATHCSGTATQCANFPTECTENSTATECPYQRTVCPTVDTFCPNVPTQCPRSRTECPSDSTFCAIEQTSCPQTVTECVESPTQCPIVSTECTGATGGLTQCPVQSTACPVVPTLCPGTHTECPETSTQTECPVAATLCPASETACPIEQTNCPAVSTQCPSAETECPSQQVQTECPAVTTACPADETQCPVEQTSCPHIPTQCVVEPTECPDDPINCPEPPDLNTGLVGHFPLDENGDDISGNGHHGTPQGGVSFVNDPERGQVASFDGVDGVIDMGDVDDFEVLDGSMSFAVWVKTAFDGADGMNILTMIERQENFGGYRFLIRNDCSSGALDFSVNYDWSSGEQLTVAASSRINDGNWHHVCGVVDRGEDTVHLYIDGIDDIAETGCSWLPQADSTGFGSSDSGTAPFILGNRHETSTYLNGLIDEVRVYRRALSQAEVDELINLPTEPPEPPDLNAGLVGHFPLDIDGDDVSGNGHHGTPQGGVTFVSDSTRGQVASFNGVDGIINMGDVDDFEVLDGSMSFSAWFKTSIDDPNSMHILSMMKQQFNYDGYRLMIRGNSTCSPNALDFNVNYDWGNEESLVVAALRRVNDGDWHHVCAVVDRTTETAHLYLDGVDDIGETGCSWLPNADSTGLGSSDSGSTSFLIGNRGTLDTYWNGEIDEVRIYDRALSQAEVDELINLPTEPPEPPDLNDGLVGHFPLDENGDDVSGNGHHGTPQGGVTFVSDPVRGQVASFNGVDGFINCGDVDDFEILDGSMSFSAWVKTAFDGANGMHLLAMLKDQANFDGYRFLVRKDCSAGALDFSVNYDLNSGDQLTVAALTRVNDGDWHHVCGVVDRDEETVHLFIDGIDDIGETGCSWLPQADSSGFGLSDSETTPFIIGNKDQTTSHWNGEIDEVRIYRRALSQAEVEELMNLPTEPPQPPDLNNGLVGHFPLDEDGNDVSGNGHHGTPQGGVSFVSDPQRGQVANFDGIDGAINMGDVDDFEILDGSKSFSAWIKTTDDLSTKSMHVLSMQKVDGNVDGYRLTLRSTSLCSPGTTFFSVDYDWAHNESLAVGTIQQLNDGAWHHVCAVVDRDEETVHLYVDGVEDIGESGCSWLPSADSTGYGSSDSGSAPFQIGRHLAGGNWAGQIDEVRIYDRALSQAEVDELINLPTEPPGLNDGLVGHFRLDNDGNDTSGNGHHGTPMGGISFVNDPERGQVASFNGVDGVIDCGDVDDFEVFDGSMSFSVWIKTAFDGADGMNFLTMLNKQEDFDGYRFLIRNDCSPGALDFSVNYDFNAGEQLTVAASTRVNDGAWHHVCGVVDRTEETVHLYIDGVDDIGETGCSWFPRADSTGYESSDSGSTPFFLGNRYQTSTHWNGMMDEVRIYNRALSGSEVQILLSL